MLGIKILLGKIIEIILYFRKSVGRIFEIAFLKILEYLEKIKTRSFKIFKIVKYLHFVDANIKQTYDIFIQFNT